LAAFHHARRAAEGRDARRNRRSHAKPDSPIHGSIAVLPGGVHEANGDVLVSVHFTPGSDSRPPRSERTVCGVRNLPRRRGLNAVEGPGLPAFGPPQLGECDRWPTARPRTSHCATGPRTFPCSTGREVGSGTRVADRGLPPP
jgi:hypothetical protein